MAAQEHLSPQQFGPMYHGTKAVIDGVRIMPGASGMAYASSDPGSAELFGRTKMPDGKVGENKVYKVIPAANDVVTKKGNFKGETHFMSPSGFIIMGEHNG